MPDPHGDKLYVNLSASQARRRLKGYGHGVRKVQSGGRDRAVIIHTATGQHLAELERKFSDVGCSHSDVWQSAMMEMPSPPAASDTSSPSDASTEGNP